jgi:signal transduction histidine kinase
VQRLRVRIARNIHDLLGHYLTALTINLQVAGRQLDLLNVATPDESGKKAIKDSIEQCHSLSKLLLSDVRDAVSDIRSKSSLNLEQTILAMTDRLPDIKVTLDYPGTISINDVNTADVLTRCVQESITNAIKHAHARTMHIAFAQTSEVLTMLVSAEFSGAAKLPKVGASKPKFTIGNGLKGMQERIKQLQGEVSFTLNNTAFVTDIKVPVRDHD